VALTVTLVLLAGATAWASHRLVLPGQIPAPERGKLQRVADSASVSTRLEGEPFLARRDVFEYLLDHPEFATHVTRTLRVARYRIWHTPEGLFIDDGWGATGHFTVVLASNGVRVVYAWGQYEQPFMPTVRGEAVGVLEYASRPAPDGRSGLVATVSGFVKLQGGLVTAATMLAGPAVRYKADLEARRLLRVFARTTRAIAENPAGVYEALRQRPDVPRTELESFRELLDLPRTSRP
jgi:hypothetical protein